jgi:PII-like signaling protein
LSGGEMLQLRFYFGERERDRTGDGERPLEAAVMEAYARRITGFGPKHGMRTDRLLTLSEDAPLVAVAVEYAEVVEALAAEVRGMAADGLVTVEPVQAVGGRDGGSGGVSTTGTATTSAAGVAASGADAEEAAGDVVKVTIWGPRSGSESPHVGAVAALHRCGAEAATVLLGVDGVLCGERRRARFVGANRSVPATTVAVGERAKIEAALGEIGGTQLVTVGVGGVVDSSRIERESHHGNAESAAPAEATRVTLVTSEIASHDGRPTYLQFVDALRREGAPGATALRGVWGFRGGGTPRGDRVLALRRDVPVLIEVVDSAERAGRWRELALSVAGEDDIVESGSIPRILTLE